MNLTKLFIAGLCATAMTASAGFIVSNDFENGTLEGGVWTGGASQAAITNLSTGVTDANTPMAGTDTKLLALDTQGAIWTNTVDSSFETVTNYVDMLVKFVPSETLPTIGEDVKLAIALQQGTPNLLALSLVDLDSVPNLTNKWFTFGAIDTNAWCRLTIAFYKDSGECFIEVKTNGAVVTLPTSFVQQSDFKLNSIGFQGTGFLDEVVVRDDDPFGGAPAAVQITLSFAAGIDSVFVGTTEILTTQTVESGSDLIITASQWKEIADVSGADVTTNWVAGAVNDSVATVKVSAATSGKTVTITAQNQTSTELLTGTAFTNAPISDVAAWAIAKGVAENEIDDGIYPNYLLNIDEDTAVPALNITSISVSNTTVTVTVEAAGVNFETINGTLKIKAYETLGGAETVTTANVTGYSPVTIVQEIGANKFVKASVE